MDSNQKLYNFFRFYHMGKSDHKKKHYLSKGKYGATGLHLRATQVLSNCRVRHKEKDMPGKFDLTTKWFIDQIIYKGEDGFMHVRDCPLAERRFHLGWRIFTKDSGRCIFDTYKDGKPNPYGPSVDRIDSRKGYTQDNCRVIMYCLNVARKNGTDAQLKRRYPKMITKIQEDYERME